MGGVWALTLGPVGTGPWGWVGWGRGAAVCLFMEGACFCPDWGRGRFGAAVLGLVFCWSMIRFRSWAAFSSARLADRLCQKKSPAARTTIRMMDRRRWGEKWGLSFEEEAAAGRFPSGKPVSHFMILRSMAKILSYGRSTARLISPAGRIYCTVPREKNNGGVCWEGSSLFQSGVRSHRKESAWRKEPRERIKRQSCQRDTLTVYWYPAMNRQRSIVFQKRNQNILSEFRRRRCRAHRRQALPGLPEGSDEKILPLQLF